MAVPTRLRNRLVHLGYKTLDDLKDVSDVEILKDPEMGKKSLDLIRYLCKEKETKEVYVVELTWYIDGFKLDDYRKDFKLFSSQEAVDAFIRKFFRGKKVRIEETNFGSHVRFWFKKDKRKHLERYLTIAKREVETV